VLHEIMVVLLDLGVAEFDVVTNSLPTTKLLVCSWIVSGFRASRIAGHFAPQIGQRNFDLKLGYFTVPFDFQKSAFQKLADSQTPPIYGV
jgi:hypothetical protein